MNKDHVPQERDLPAGRLAELKEALMAQIEQDLEAEGQTARVATHPRWRRVGLAAAAVAGVSALATVLVIGGEQDGASANTVVRTDDGAILIGIHDAKSPDQLEQRLNDLGVPAEVDFLETGYGCDRARSSGWVQEPRGEDLFTHAPGEQNAWILHPGQLRPGETAVFEFQVDEHDDEIAANALLRLSTTPVGECEPVPNGSIVDAEAGIAGG